MFFFLFFRFNFLVAFAAMLTYCGLPWAGIPTHMVNDIAASLWAMLELNQDAVFRWAAQAPW